MFMDAMTAATSKKETRKRKRRLSSSKEGDAPSQKDSKETNTKSVSAAPMKFYQDTLDETNETKDESAIKEENDNSTENCDEMVETKKIKTDDSSIKDEPSENVDDANNETSETEIENIKKEPGPGCGPDGPPGVLMIHRRKGKKKSLRWKPQEALEEIRYFELDENERVNVTKTFVDMKQMEHVSEREAFMIAKKAGAEDLMVEQTNWAPLIEVDDVPELPQVTSKEMEIQAEREKTVLKTIYFNRAMIPDSPSEPDVITFQNSEPKTIPLFDITGNADAIHDYTNMPWPEPRGSPPHNTDSLSGFNGLDLNQFSANPFGTNVNWPLGLTTNAVRPQPLTPFGTMLPPEAIAAAAMPFAPNMNPLNPTLCANFVSPNAGAGFINNFRNLPPPINDNRGNGPRNNSAAGGKWFGGNTNGNNNWQQQGNNQNNNNNQRQNWMQNRRVCKSFQRGFCRHGDSCKFLHPGVNCPPF